MVAPNHDSPIRLDEHWTVNDDREARLAEVTSGIRPDQVELCPSVRPIGRYDEVDGKRTFVPKPDFYPGFVVDRVPHPVSGPKLYRATALLDHRKVHDFFCALVDGLDPCPAPVFDVWVYSAHWRTLLNFEGGEITTDLRDNRSKTAKGDAYWRFADVPAHVLNFTLSRDYCERVVRQCAATRIAVLSRATDNEVQLNFQKELVLYGKNRRELDRMLDPFYERNLISEPGLELPSKYDTEMFSAKSLYQQCVQIAVALSPYLEGGGTAGKAAA